jgi:hypothetical protein
MKDWKPEKPEMWHLKQKWKLQGRLEEGEAALWELGIARYFAQTFLDTFGRPACLPYTLSEADSKEVKINLALSDLHSSIFCRKRKIFRI